MWVHRSSQYVLVGEQLARPSQVHKHFVLQLSVSVGPTLSAVVEDTVVPSVAGILVAPNVAHTLCGDVVHVFVDPLNPLGRRLWGMLDKRHHLTLSAAQTAGFLGEDAGTWLKGPRVTHSDAHVDALLSELSHANPQPPLPAIDFRIARVIRRLREHLDDRLPLEALASEVRLSPGRLTHLFTQEMGISMKQFVVWLRVVAVLESLPSGGQLGTLAHDSGFVDQPAFARTYRETFGRTPTSFRKASGGTFTAPDALEVAAPLKRS